MFSAIVLTLGLLSPNVQPEDPILATVRSKHKHPDKPFAMVIQVKVNAGKESEFEKAFAVCQKATRQEKGCKAYDLSRDTDHPEIYMIYERWATVDALEAHLKAPHTVKLLGSLGEIVAGPPDVKIYSVVGD